MYKQLNGCRACGYGGDQSPDYIKKASNGQALVQVFDLGLQPLANDFVKRTEAHAGYAPLKVLYCPNCSLAQLSVVVNSDLLYKDYKFFTSVGTTLGAHYEKLYSDIEASLGPLKEKSMIEIGGNNGTLCEYFNQRGIARTMNIDPASRQCYESMNRGVATFCSPFDQQIGIELGLHWKPDILMLRHVFCHIDNWQGLIRGLTHLAHPETVVYVEVPYVKNLLQNTEFDTIYHEHLAFMSLRAMEALLNETLFTINDILRYPLHGGVVMFELRHKDSSHLKPRDKVRALIDEENIELQDWQKFEERAMDAWGDLEGFLRDQRDDKKRVYGMGASAKSTVWLNACQLSKNDIACITDTTTAKMYCNSPGTDIPVVDEGAILRDLPDYVVVFCWNYRDEVLQKMALAREKGVKFVFPIPKLEIV